MLRMYNPLDGVTLNPRGCLSEKFVSWDEALQDLKNHYADPFEALQTSSPDKPLVGKRGFYWRADYTPFEGHGFYL